jgi:hypothetical protein
MTPLISTPRRRLSAPPCEIVAIQTGAAKRAQCRGRAAVKVGSRMTAARVTRGAISLSSSSHFPLMLNSYAAKPVALPPGRARLSTQPPPTGSMVVTNTIGTVRLTCCKAPTIEPAVPTMTSGESATNSAAYLRKRSRSSAPQRYSMRTLPPTVQPRSWSPCAKADILASASGSSALWLMSTPMRSIRSPGCARAASGHVAAAPPSSVMNERRLIRSPRRQESRRGTVGASGVSDRKDSTPRCSRRLLRCGISTIAVRVCQGASRRNPLAASALIG